jgi:hypothetical protein
MDKEKADQLLEAAKLAQHAFWDALSELEAELDIEIDSTNDLADIDVEMLLEEAAA